MKKKTLISKLREKNPLRELKRSELDVAVGGIPTITDCGGKCEVHIEEGDQAPA